MEHADSQLMNEFDPQEAFCKVLLDAYVVINPQGKILKSNQMFSQIVGMKAKQILKTENINEIITFEHQYEPLPIQKLLANSTQNVYFDVKGLIKKADDEIQTLDLSLGVSHFTNNKFTSGMFLIIRDITAEKSLVSKYAEKNEASQRDGLTTLYNRRFLEDSLQQAFANLNQIPANEGEPVSFIIMDIDFFKKINDGFGHQAGDYVLSEMGKLLKHTFRKTDIPARIGGEEFVVLLSRTNLKGASIAAEKFRSLIENTKFSFEGKDIPVTISIGVAKVEAGNPAKITPELLMARADEALYASKHNGRNRVTVHDGNALTAYNISLGAI